MTRTAVIRRDYMHYVKKYNRYEKRHTNIPVHLSPALTAKEGDIIIAG
jgi:small subunit ribosomal protein S11e